MRPVRQPDRAASARHFLHRHAMLDVAQSEPAIFFRRGDPVQAEFPILGQRSSGNALSRSICAARGAISFSAKLRALSRIISALSPRSKSKARGALGIMGEALGKGSGETTLCAIGGAVQPFAQSRARAGERDAANESEIETFQRDTPRLAIQAPAGALRCPRQGFRFIKNKYNLYNNCLSHRDRGMRQSVQAVAPVSERGNRARAEAPGLRQESQRPRWQARPLAGRALATSRQACPRLGRG